VRKSLRERFVQRAAVSSHRARRSFVEIDSASEEA